jgi:hypothetical protein
MAENEVESGFRPEEDDFVAKAKSLIGQKVAVLGIRYQYRGILSKVGKDFLVLSTPRAVEDSGPSVRDKPKCEDIIPSEINILFSAIELLYQPTWCFAPLSGEKE